ncbi:WxL domain surface cell wall-binding [Pilibacter termitis]|uniref:WxL domain surface cell wall-binding n=1 Tax=Pilibacter termitis TaxID=263852 RepID=A0A1T4P728_9ENTE|nr:WxL domain-containing protein [Pilibacter termitis]SJZ87385.1 WxL domain surface cell wall-binding [Pilibacter termitis]
MRDKKIVLLILFFLFVNSKNALADEGIGVGKVGFQGRYPDEVVNPEKPTEPSDSGKTDKTKGELRIDYVPYFFFDKVAIVNDKDYSLTAHAQYYTKGESPTGNFVQIVDERKENGWSLTLKQESEFTLEEDENAKSQMANITQAGAISKETYKLKGATLSLSNLWASSVHLGVSTSVTPTIKSDVIKMDVGKVYEVANAKGEVGKGRWAIVAGYSEEYAQKNGSSSGTLTPVFDKENNPVLLSSSIKNIQSYGFDNEKQQVHYNEAVKLNIPQQEIHSGIYQAKFVWTLTAAP